MNHKYTAIAIALTAGLAFASASSAQKSRAEVKADAAANKASGPTGELVPAKDQASGAKPASPRANKSTPKSSAKPQGEANQDKPKP